MVASDALFSVAGLAWNAVFAETGAVDDRGMRRAYALAANLRGFGFRGFERLMVPAIPDGAVISVHRAAPKDQLELYSWAATLCPVFAGGGGFFGGAGGAHKGGGGSAVCFHNGAKITQRWVSARKKCETAKIFSLNADVMASLPRASAETLTEH